MDTDFTSAMILGQCPRCGEGSMFNGWIALHETCPSCGARFERWEGAALGSVAFGYGIGAAVAAVVLVFLWSRGRLGDHAEYWVAGISVASVLATYRPVKGWWIAMLHSMGYVYPDPPPAPDVSP